MRTSRFATLAFIFVATVGGYYWINLPTLEEYGTAYKAAEKEAHRLMAIGNYAAKDYVAPRREYPNSTKLGSFSFSWKSDNPKTPTIIVNVIADQGIIEGSYLEK